MIAPKEFPVLFDRRQIQEMVQSVASNIEASYPANEELVVVGVLKGAWVFHADLVRSLKRSTFSDFIRASSYGDGMESSGKVKIVKDLELSVEGRHVLLIEDIIDTGRTLQALQAHILAKGAKSVKLAALLDKKCKREVSRDADFVGAEIGDKFVVGYGLDWAEKYRSIPEIHYVPEEYAASGIQP